MSKYKIRVLLWIWILMSIFFHCCIYYNYVLFTVKSLSLEYMATCRKKYLLIWTYNFAKPMTLSNIWQPRRAGAVAALHKIFAGWLTRFAENLHTVCAVVVLPSKRVAVQLWWRAQTEGVQSAGTYIQFGAVLRGGEDSQHWPGCTKFLSVQLCSYGDKILLCLYT